jgi:hypothetical protein
VAEEVAGTTYIVSVTKDSQCRLAQPLTFLERDNNYLYHCKKALKKNIKNQ